MSNVGMREACLENDPERKNRLTISTLSLMGEGMRFRSGVNLRKHWWGIRLISGIFLHSPSSSIHRTSLPPQGKAKAGKGKGRQQQRKRVRRRGDDGQMHQTLHTHGETGQRDLRGNVCDLATHIDQDIPLFMILFCIVVWRCKGGGGGANPTQVRVCVNNLIQIQVIIIIIIIGVSCVVRGMLRGELTMLAAAAGDRRSRSLNDRPGICQPGDPWTDF